MLEILVHKYQHQEESRVTTRVLFSFFFYLGLSACQNSPDNIEIWSPGSVKVDGLFFIFSCLASAVSLLPSDGSFNKRKRVWIGLSLFSYINSARR